MLLIAALLPVIFTSSTLSCTLHWKIIDVFGEETTLAYHDSFMRLRCTGDNGEDPKKFLLQMSYRKGLKSETKNFTTSPVETSGNTNVWDVQLKDWLGYQAICLCTPDLDAENKPTIRYILCNETVCSTCLKTKTKNQMTGLCYFGSRGNQHCGENIPEDYCLWQGRPKIDGFSNLCVVDEQGAVSSKRDLCDHATVSNGYLRVLMDISNVAKCPQAEKFLRLRISGRTEELYEYGKTYYITDQDLKFTAKDCVLADQLKCERLESGNSAKTAVPGDCTKGWIIDPNSIADFDKPIKIKCTFKETVELWTAQLVFYVIKTVKQQAQLSNVTCFSGEPYCFWKVGSKSLGVYSNPATEATALVCPFEQFSDSCQPHLHTAVIMSTNVSQKFPEECIEQKLAIQRNKATISTWLLVAIILFCLFITIVTIVTIAYIVHKDRSKKKGKIDFKKTSQVPSVAAGTDFPLARTDSWTYRNTVDIKL